MDVERALAYLDGHVNLEADRAPAAAARRLDGMRRLAFLLGDPQHAYPVVHITGTNGKGSVARMLTALLVAQGLSVGTYTSPDLERVNERLAWNGEPIPDDALVDGIETVAGLESLMDESPSRFDILTAAAYRWFADVAVDVAVIEVGLGGRWDSTNVADGRVAVVTNVSLDHAEHIGPTLHDIAREKAGIVKRGATLVLGETDPGLASVFRQAEAERVWAREEDFDADANRPAHGGRLMDLRTPAASYADVFVPVHGQHQGDNAALALAAAEAFFDSPLAPEVVEEAFAALQLPGRLEVVARQPLIVLDGAHNPAGASALAEALDETFGGATGRVLVLGLLVGRDVDAMVGALASGPTRQVFACPPPSPRAMAPEEVVASAARAGVPAEPTSSVVEALARAKETAGPGEMIVVAGSLYVVGTARAMLTGSPTHHGPTPAPDTLPTTGHVP